MFNFSLLKIDKKSVIFLLLYFVNFIWIIGFIFIGSQRATWFAYDLLSILSSIIVFIYLCKNISIINNPNVLLISIFLFILYMCNVLINGLTIVSLFKFYYYIRGLPIFILFAYLIRRKPELTNVFFKHVFFIVFLQFWINIPYLLYQYNLGFNFDDITGFYGIGASHIPCFVWIFIILFQFTRSVNFIIIFAEMIIMFYLGVITDNKTFYFFSITMIFLYYFSSFNLKNIFKAITIGILTCCVIYAGMATLPRKNLYFIVGINKNINDYFLGKSKDERMDFLVYALTNSDSHYFGRGSGIISHAFQLKGELCGVIDSHLDMTDMVTIVYECGIVFYLFIVILYSMVFASFFKNRRFYTFIIIFFILNFNLYYTLIFTDPRNIYMLTLIIGLFAWAKNNIIQNEQIQINDKKG